MPREVCIGSPSRGQVVVGGVHVPVIAGEAGGGAAVRVSLTRPARNSHSGDLATAQELHDAAYEFVLARQRLGAPVIVDVDASTLWRPAIPHADGVVADPGVLAGGDLARTAAQRDVALAVRRPEGGTVDEWLAAAESCVAAGVRRVLLCEGGSGVAGSSGTHGQLAAPDIALVQRIRERTNFPVLADLSAGGQLAGAAVVAGADGVVLARDASSAEAAHATDLATTLAAFGRDMNPGTLDGARQGIDQVDACLADLLERRAELARVVQHLKPVGGFAGRDPERERELVAAMAYRAPRLGLARVRRIMEVVIEAGLDLAESGAADENAHAVGDARSGRNVGRSAQRRDVGEPNIPRAS